MDLLQKIREALANLANLGAEELKALKADIAKCYKQFDGEDTVEAAEALTELADIGDAVTARIGQIQAEAQAAKEAAQAARDRLKGLDGDDESEENDEEDVPPTGDEPEGDKTGDGPDDVNNAPLPVAASAHRSTPARMRGFGGPTGRSPELADPSDRRIRVLAASSNLIGKNAGEEFTSREDLANTIATKLDRMDPRDRAGRVVIASADWSHLYGEDRHLRGDFNADALKLEAGRKAFQGLSPLGASGGVPLPTNVDYAEQTWAVADRPVKDGLDPYSVDRGGLLYRQPPTLAALASATTIWTNANDIDPTDPTTKPVLQITSPDTEQVFINAVPTRLGFGNLMGQFDPETIAANTDLAIAAAARIAETNLISSIAGFAVGASATTQVMGASRDLFQTIIQVCAAYRFQFRLARDLPLTILLPSWALDIMKADRVWELAHDSAGSFNPFAWTDAQIEADLAAYGIDPIWSMDALPANTSVNPHYVSQNFTAFTQNAALPAFPTQLVWLLFIKGSIQFLDGGRLDLGVVRDSTLDATNDYETFVETFENVANRGFAGSVVQVVSNLLPTGASSEGIAA